MIPGTRPLNALDFEALRRFFDPQTDEPVRLGRIGWDGDADASHVTITPGRDVDVHVTLRDGFPITARLAASGGVWRVPAIGEECVVMAPPGDWATPGAPIAVCRHRLPPSSLTPSVAVIEAPAGGLVIGDGASAAAARVGDGCDAGTLILTPTGTVAGYAPPGTAPVVPSGGSTLALRARIDSGSAAVRIL